MAVVAVVRELKRYRLLVALGAFVALTTSVLIMYQVSPGLPPKLESRKYEVGVASAAVLIDSNSSQVVDLGEVQSRADVASLTERAQLLADLVASSPLKERIAERAGIAPDTLIATAPGNAAGGPQPGAAEGATIAADDRRASTLNVSVRDAAPIITVVANAPTRAIAGRLADGAVIELREHLNALATNDQVPDARRLVVDPLGAAHSSTQTRGPTRVFAIAVGIFLFALWCGAILALVGFVRGWQVAAELEWDAESAFEHSEPEPPRPDNRVRSLAAVHGRGAADQDEDEERDPAVTG